MDSPKGTEPPSGSGPTRRRRRRGGPRASDGKASDKPSERKPEGERKGRGPRRRGGRKPSNRAARVLSKQAESVDLDKNVDEPLTKLEVAVLRDHFRFLRANRKELRLKVNANEDLLLNGVREPEHRGVCRHLLGKVEKSKVLAAAERLEPARAARLLAGIIGFSSNIEYVLLFLEKIKLSSSPEDATAALSQGLRSIEFDTVSNAQMRRVLQLIVELFGEKERPALLLGMLESTSFRAAFDKSMVDLPDALSHLVLPLRAAQAVILRGDPNTFDSETLRDGVNLLLDLDSKILLRHGAEMRQRLFHFGLQSCVGPGHRLHDRLKMLLRNFSASDSHRGARGIALARHLIAAGSEGDAKQILQNLAHADPNFDVPSRWLEYLEAERLDRFVLLEQPSDQMDSLGQNPRRAGIWLETMRPVWVQVAHSEGIASHEESVALLSQLAVPGVVTVLGSGTTKAGEPYFVVANVGESLDRALTENAGLDLVEGLRVCHEVVCLLNALAAVGIQLPDVKLSRFSRGPSGDLLLTDVAGAKRVDPDAAGGFNLELARSCCIEVFDRARRYIVPDALRTMVSGANSCAELARGLARF